MCKAVPWIPTRHDARRHGPCGQGGSRFPRRPPRPIMRPVDRAVAVALRPMTPHVVRKAETLVNDRSELQLIEAARTGDRDAFNRLVQSYHKPLLGFIRGKGVRDSDCDDVAQEVWTRVWQKIHAAPAEGGDPEKGGSSPGWPIVCDTASGTGWPRRSAAGHRQMIRHVRRTGARPLTRRTRAAPPAAGGFRGTAAARRSSAAVIRTNSWRSAEIDLRQPQPPRRRGLPRYVSRRHGAEPLDQLTRTFVDRYTACRDRRCRVGGAAGGLCRARAIAAPRR